MTQSEVDYFCQDYLNSEMTPEDYYNQRVNKTLSFDDSKTLINLLYELDNIDKRILDYVNNWED